MAALRRLGEANGGGLMGVITGALAEYQSLGHVTAADAGRIMACFEAFEKAGGGTQAARESASSVLHDLYAQAVADPYSTPFALQVLSVAASGGTRMVDDPSAAEIGAADAVGMFFLGGVASCVAASYVAAHLDVHVTYS
ncbi:hypothetical protein ACQB6R_03080 [Propionibacteriaceae bacterium G1746]|uniref:hypothetical protein n=1 Tax=Aestuariimicrobium sp. G57 TaxID=3418485 RepID=UPI003C23926E